MKLEFESWDEWNTLRQSVHDACMFWIKVRQDAQGKIRLNVSGEPTHYTEDYAIEEIVNNAKLLEQIELAPHPDWETGDIVRDTSTSAMVSKCRKLSHW